MALVTEAVCDVCGKSAEVQAAPAAIAAGFEPPPPVSTLPLHYMTVAVKRATGNLQFAEDVQLVVCSYECAEQAMANSRRETSAERGALTRASGGEEAPE